MQYQVSFAYGNCIKHRKQFIQIWKTILLLPERKLIEKFPLFKVKIFKVLTYCFNFSFNRKNFRLTLNKKTIFCFSAAMELTVLKHFTAVQIFSNVFDIVEMGWNYLKAPTRAGLDTVFTRGFDRSSSCLIAKRLYSPVKIGQATCVYIRVDSRFLFMAEFFWDWGLIHSGKQCLVMMVSRKSATNKSVDFLDRFKEFFAHLSTH